MYSLQKLLSEQSFSGKTFISVDIQPEYDEPRHYDGFGNLKNKDIDRMKIIKDNLKCEFWRYNEKRDTLKKYD